MIAYKLMTRRKDGTLGPLFMNVKQRVPLNKWLPAEAHRSKRLAFRPGWHALKVPVAPHLKKLPNRVWVKVELENFETFVRPENQGGKWFLAQKMKVLQILG